MIPVFLYSFSSSYESVIMELNRCKRVLYNTEGVFHMGEWYLEYEIQVNRPGLLGDISSLLGMLRVNIATINSVDAGYVGDDGGGRRGMLLTTEDDAQIKRFELIASTMETIKLVKIRPPKLSDRLAVRHGRYILRDSEDRKTFRFLRNELGILVDFMAELFKEKGHKLIGIRGMPRVGKTESVVAASVCANKKWIFLSSTMIKQTVRSSLMGDEFSDNNIFILDGIVSRKASDERHLQLVREMMRIPSIKVVEHPDIFVQHSEYDIEDFDYIIELRTDPDQEITYEMMEKNHMVSSKGAMDNFDIFNF